MRSILSLSEGQFHSPSGEYNGGALPSGVRLSGLRFFYSVEIVRSEQKKVVNIENDVLENALRSVLMGTGLTFTIMNDVVVIKEVGVATADSLQ